MCWDSGLIVPTLEATPVKMLTFKASSGVVPAGDNGGSDPAQTRGDTSRVQALTGPCAVHPPWDPTLQASVPRGGPQPQTESQGREGRV